MASPADDHEDVEVLHDEHKEGVKLYVYDLSQGMAKMMSGAILGKQIDGIWHTGIVVYGHEYYYGGGIQSDRPGQTMAGTPTQVIDLGVTDVPMKRFHDFLKSVSHRFTPETYSLLSHNCNNFTSECSQFLLGKDIPDWITGLPEEAMNTPMGAMLRPMITAMENNMKQANSPALVPWGSEAVNLPPVKHAPTKVVRRPRSNTNTPSASSAAATPTSASFSSAPAAETKMPSHAHAVLPLELIGPSSVPLLSSDNKFKSFATVIKVTSKKVPEAQRLTSQDQQTLTQVVADLTANPPSNFSEATPGPDLPAGSYALFDKLLQWPTANLFGVLGLFRLVVLRPAALKHYAANFTGPAVQRVLAALPSEQQDAPVPAQLMALCTVSNMLVSHSFATALFADERALDAAIHSLTCPDQKLRMMGAAVLYNASLRLPKEDSDLAVRCASMLTEAASQETDPQTCLRELLALGHLVFCNDACAMIVMALELNMQAVAARFAGSTAVAKKIQTLAKDIGTIMSVGA